MERTAAFTALFGKTPGSATQEHVDLLRGKTALTDAELAQLPDEIVERVNAFIDDSETFAENETDPARSLLLKSLAGKATHTPIVQPNLDESVVPASDNPGDDEGDTNARPAQRTRPTMQTDRPRREDRPPREDGARRDGRDDRPRRGDERDGNRGDRSGKDGRSASHPCEVEFHVRIGGKTPEDVARLAADLHEMLQRKTVTVEAQPVIQPVVAQKSADDLAFEALLPEIEALFTAKADGDPTATDSLFALHERFPEGSALREKVDSYVNARIANPGVVRSPAFQKRFGVPAPA